MDYGRDADSVDIAVAFLKRSGLQLMLPQLGGRRTRLLVGLDFQLTDPDALRLALENRIPCKVYRSRVIEDEATFHPKVYIFNRGGNVMVLVGSSNLTKGGLEANVEASLSIEGVPTDSPVKEAMAFFEEKWNSPAAENLTEALLQRYSVVYKELRKARENPSRHETAVIICHTKEHDANNIYDRLVGVPDSDASLKPYPWVKAGTRIYMYYKKTPACPESGIYTVVEATGEAFYDDSRVDEWADVWPNEKFPHRIPTRPVARYSRPAALPDLRLANVARKDTGKTLSLFHLRKTLCPISSVGARKIDGLLRRKNV